LSSGFWKSYYELWAMEKQLWESSCGESRGPFGGEKLLHLIVTFIV
jgi:hypothetical protein